MSDCANVEIRELLPEYLHDRLMAPDRMRVDAHLAACEDCSAELMTLRTVRQALSHAPAVDVAAIVRALPRPTRRVRQLRRSVSHGLAWRIAAAVSFISLGGISLAVARSFFGPGPVNVVDSAAIGRPVDTARGVPVATVASATQRPAITFAGGVSDLAAEDVETLLGSIESLEATPPVDPDAAPQTNTGRVRSDSSGE